MTDVVQIDSDGWVSSESTTTASGSVRMSADRTLVSSRIMAPRGPLRRVTTQFGEVVFDAVTPRTVTRSSTRAGLVRSALPERRRGGSPNLLLGGASMRSGPTLERFLQVLIELADQELCHDKMIA